MPWVPRDGSARQNGTLAKSQKKLRSLREARSGIYTQSGKRSIPFMFSLQTYKQDHQETGKKNDEGPTSIAAWVLPEEAYDAEIEFKTETLDEGRAAAWGTSGLTDA